MVKLRRGFRKEAEEYAADFRDELNLEVHDPIDPVLLADHLSIPVIGLSDHPTISDDVKRFFATAGQDNFSATTIADGSYREIIHNDAHHPNRQNSNITHEVSHIVLGHPPKPPMIADGCRDFDPTLEKEANELGFTLLVPKIAALFAVEQFGNLAEAALHFGVSLQLLRYRIRITNADGWAKNRRAKAYG
ncbi:ImmA/IrrE family metallo-endopeptidase [bacterium]|nr:ImmA/IrrE family metallo-endopeptidase [bacterium]